MNKFSHISFVGVEPPSRPERSPHRQPTAPGRSIGLPNELASGRTQLPLEPEAAPEPFLAWLFSTAGLDAGAYRSNALERRLAACLRSLRVSNTEAARALLQRNPELLANALDAVLIGVSGFFRDGAVFEHLRRHVLPELLHRLPGLRVLSLGCSNGQELYSIGILLDELHALEHCYLLGVDCRSEAIALAKTGSFRLSDLETVPPPLREKYFRVERSRAWISLAHNPRFIWSVENVLRNSPAPTPRGDTEFWDLILFRNLAIYLKAESTDILWRTLSRGLRPGGVLVTGKAERPPDGLPFRRLFPCIFEKRAQT